VRNGICLNRLHDAAFDVSWSPKFRPQAKL
jgi:hypothetical protein